MDGARVTSENLQPIQCNANNVQDLNTAPATSSNDSTDSHQSKHSDFSNVSSSPSVLKSTSRELLAARNDTNGQTIAIDDASRLTQVSQTSKWVSPIPRPGKVLHKIQQATQRPATNVMNANRKPREIAGPAAIPGGLLQRNLYAVAENSKWKSWDEVQVRIFGLPRDTTTRDLAMWFRDEGAICSIKIFENQQGSGDGSATLVFRPPPARPFWNAQNWNLQRGGQTIAMCQIRLGGPPKPFLHPSPARSRAFYPENITMNAETMDFGLMDDEKTLLGMKKVTADTKRAITFQLNLFYRELHIAFKLPILDWRSRELSDTLPELGKLDREEDFKFKIQFRDLNEIREVPLGPGCFAVFITLEVPPKVFKRVDDLATHENQSRVWNDKESWFRQTDVVYNPSSLKRLPLSLQKTRAVLDLGRWITYRLVFDVSKFGREVHQQIRDVLRDHGLNIVPCHDLKVVDCDRPTIWKHIDRPSQHSNIAGGALQDLSWEEVPYLSFEVRYQLEVCISHGIFNEFNLSRDFILKLAGMQPELAQGLLEHVANQKKPVFRPMSIFDLESISGTISSAIIPNYCALVRSATVTPTAIYFHTPSVETSNRVIRQYTEYADRFLRVRFSDEQSEGRIFSTASETMNDVFARIKRTLSYGLRIGDRRYEFLAFGNSQFREHGAYFFAPTSQVDAKRIRMWMGSFQDIEVVAKYASRLGQCFSTTRAITSVTPHIKELDDIHHNKYCFTDGVGRISPFLAQLAASELGILRLNREAPSVFQFRLGGCKGVLAVSPTSKARDLHLRFSQYKFPASHEGLDIIHWSRFACAKLNQQLILVLSSLKVPDDVFKYMMQLQLNELRQAMTDSKTALNLLQKYVDYNQMTLTLAGMIVDGFQNTEEPFTLALLQLWRAWSTKYLKEKAQIAVSEGALLLGCVDESDTLRGHYDDIHEKMPGVEASLEERSQYVAQVFVQLSKDPENRESRKPKIILGPMLLARNPSLHAGDIRVVCGVDVPELHHLKDVVVLPQNGDRDLASMCSGGDLDGDDFLVIWDHNLLPREWNHPPMKYSAPPPLFHKKEITVDDLTSFFVTYMKNDSLGQIAVAHRVWADISEEGVMDHRCIKLAQLHSDAVDFPKTGQPAHMTKDLQPRMWPHYMQRKNTKKNKIYVSHKILGQLYDQVERTDFFPDFSRPFSQTILQAYTLQSAILADARQLKKEYDAAMCRIMAKLDIKTEFEVWSTFALSHNKSNDFKFHEEIGQLSMSLKEQYRDLCVKAAGGKDHDQLGPFVAAMYQVTSEEIAKAVKMYQQTHIFDGRPTPVRRMVPENMPKMSFPWIFHDVLGKIANPHTSPQCTGLQVEDTAQPQATHSVSRKGRYVADTNVMLPDLKTAQGVIHPGDLFRPFASQRMEHPEQYERENIQYPKNMESSEATTETMVSDVYQRTTVPLPLRKVPSPVSQTSDATDMKTPSGRTIGTPTPSQETDKSFITPNEVPSPDFTAAEVQLPKNSNEEQTPSVQNQQEVLAAGICFLRKVTPLDSMRSDPSFGAESGDSSNDADIEDAEEVVLQPIPERPSVNKLLEAFSFQEEEEEGEEEEDKEED